MFIEHFEKERMLLKTTLGTDNIELSEYRFQCVIISERIKLFVDNIPLG